MKLTLSPEINPIGEIARNNHNTIEVFNRYGIDFFCKSKSLLIEACAQANCNYIEVADEVRKAIGKEILDENDYNSWSLDRLITHIIDSHHQYVNIHVPEIKATISALGPVVEMDGFNIRRIVDLFNQLANDMKQHMQKEELGLFPAIKKLETINALLPGTSVKSLINVVEFEHDTSGIIIKQINRLCQNYVIPVNAKPELASFFTKLHDFETDLKMHIHVENNVLHPKAIELEQALVN